MNKTDNAPRSRVSVLTLTLEEAWRGIQTRHADVPNVVVVVGPVSTTTGRADRYGHFTVNPTWTVRADTQHEVLIAAEGLARGARQVFRTLLHEAVHAAQEMRGEKGVTQRGIHNATFKRGAEAFGLVAAEEPGIGWTTPDVTDETAAEYSDEIARIDRALTVARFAGSHDPDALARAIAFMWCAWGHGWTVNTGGEGAFGIIPRTVRRSVRAGSQTIAMTCACEVARKIRAHRNEAFGAPIVCGECEEPFLPAGER